MSTTKDLLSQNEIDALLDIFSSPTEERSNDIVFELRMAKVAKGIENYLENFGLVLDGVKVSKNIAVDKNSYSYNSDYPYLDTLSIDNRLVLTVLVARFGSKNSDISLERALTSLEKELFHDISKEIIYIFEKELDSYLVKESGNESLVGQSVLVTLKNVQFVINFSFANETAKESVPASLKEHKPQESDDVAGTKIEALLGTIATKVLKPGVIYKVHAFSKKRAVLLIDRTLPFMANRLQESDKKLLLLLQEAVTDKRILSGYYLCIAGSRIDDETLLGLERGTFLELHMYDDVEIHKDGKIVVKAKVLVTNGEIAVKVIEG